ncbi:Armadillo repeat-containing protein 8 [Borealophlyctis nickersoniae]|nr:Armadillo repeat-containing protein 8 [Borealophlyctis nickersoniae]
MVSSKHELAISSLSSSDDAERTRAVRFIKNSIIGNRTKKELYLKLGVAPRLTSFLSDPSCDVDLKIQVAVVLGSLAHGNDQNINTLVQAGAVRPLLGTLASLDYRLVEAGARALKAIFQCPNAPHQDVYKATYIQDLIALLSPSIHATVIEPNNSGSGTQRRSVPVRISEVAASILAKVSTSPEEQVLVAQAGAIPLLVRLLDPQWAGYPKVHEASLEALANLARENSNNAQTIVNCRGCRPPEHQQDITLTVLPTLIRLFSEPAPMNTVYGSSWATVQERAPRVFADLIEQSEELQKAAMEGDAIVKLATVIVKKSEEAASSAVSGHGEGKKSKNGAGTKSASLNQAAVLASAGSSGHGDRILESALRGIAAVCSLKEECRKQVIDAKLLPHIVAAMSHPSTAVRGAACECTRSLSRSVKYLRTSLVDAGVAIPLFRLLADESDDVQITASATLCNIVLDFSPMKKTVLDNGGVERLVGLVHSEDPRLRLNAVWALKNLLYQADSEIKERVMRELSWDGLQSLINDEELGIQEQALNLLRNLACGKETDIEEVFRGLGEQKLMSILERKLTEMADHDEIVLQTLYVIVNVSTGNDRHKSAIMGCFQILQSILGFMAHPKSSIRVATIWCVINLTWTDDPGSQERVDRLRSLGFETCLKSMSEDSNMDVKDRVKTALGNFGQGVVVGNGGAATGTAAASAAGPSPMVISGSASGSSNMGGGRSRSSSNVAGPGLVFGNRG